MTWTPTNSKPTSTIADGKVEVTDLQLATHEMVERVKELDAAETYRMDVEFGDAVDAEALQDALAELDGATIQQETPQRVTHRRADLTRTRAVYDAEGELTDDRHATANPRRGRSVRERTRLQR